MLNNILLLLLYIYIFVAVLLISSEISRSKAEACEAVGLFEALSVVFVGLLLDLVWMFFALDEVTCARGQGSVRCAEA